MFSGGGVTARALKVHCSVISLDFEHMMSQYDVINFRLLMISSHTDIAIGRDFDLQS